MRGTAHPVTVFTSGANPVLSAPPRLSTIVKGISLEWRRTKRQLRQYVAPPRAGDYVPLTGVCLFRRYSNRLVPPPIWCGIGPAKASCQALPAQLSRNLLARRTAKPDIPSGHLHVRAVPSDGGLNPRDVQSEKVQKRSRIFETASPAPVVCPSPPVNVLAIAKAARLASQPKPQCRTNTGVDEKPQAPEEG